MHSIFLKYCPPLLRSAPLSPTFHHPVQVKGHLPLLRQAHDPLHATDPSQLPPSSPDPTRESISVTGTWYTRDQSQNQQDPNFMGAARTRRKRCLSAGVCMKADWRMVICHSLVNTSRNESNTEHRTAKILRPRLKSVIWPLLQMRQSSFY